MGKGWACSMKLDLVPQSHYTESGVAGDEEISITMDNAAQELEGYAVEEENEEPYFAMSVS